MFKNQPKRRLQSLILDPFDHAYSPNQTWRKIQLTIFSPSCLLEIDVDVLMPHFVLIHLCDLWSIIHYLNLQFSHKPLYYNCVYSTQSCSSLFVLWIDRITVEFISVLCTCSLPSYWNWVLQIILFQQTKCDSTHILNPIHLFNSLHYLFLWFSIPCY